MCNVKKIKKNIRAFKAYRKYLLNSKRLTHIKTLINYYKNVYNNKCTINYKSNGYGFNYILSKCYNFVLNIDHT